MKTTQAAKNVDTFDALPVGSGYSLVGRFGGSHPCRGNTYLVDTYTKVSDEKVQASDGRIWPFAFTEGPGGSCILVPQGAYSAKPYIVVA